MNPQDENYLENTQHPLESIQEAGLIQAKQIGDDTNALLETIVQQNEKNNPEPILEAQLVQSMNSTKQMIETIAPSLKAQEKMSNILTAFMTTLRGEKGEKGDDGKNGKDGKDGRDGKDGKNGKDGRDGKNGVDGLDGKNGKDGAKGEKGDKGDKGDSGKDGKSVNEKTLVEKVIKKVTDIVSVNAKETISNEMMYVKQQVASRTYALKEMEDVTTENATDGQYMRYNSTTKKWEPAALEILNGLSIANTTTNNTISVDQNGDVGDDVGTDGAIHIENTGNDGIGLGVFTNNGATATSPLISAKADNAAFPQPVVKLVHDGGATNRGVIHIGDGIATNQFVLFQTNNNTDVGVGFLLQDGTTVRGYVKMDSNEDLRIKGDEIRFDLNSTNAVVIDGTGKITSAANTINIATKTPASATATGTAGDIAWDSNYVYVCVATNTWKRSALTTW